MSAEPQGQAYAATIPQGGEDWLTENPSRRLDLALRNEGNCASGLDRLAVVRKVQAAFTLRSHHSRVTEGEPQDDSSDHGAAENQCEEACDKHRHEVMLIKKPPARLWGVWGYDL